MALRKKPTDNNSKNDSNKKNTSRTSSSKSTRSRASTKSTTTKKRTSTRKRKSKTTKKIDYAAYFKSFVQALKNFATDVRTRRITGLSFWMLALFMLIASISYLFNWGFDQSHIRDATFLEVIRGEVPTYNLLGGFGSYLTHYFFYKWFGLASFIVIIVVFQTGSKLLYDRTEFSLFKTYQYAFPAILLSSVILGFFFSGEESGFPWGGGFGNYVSDWMISFIGFIGTLISLLFLCITTLLILFNDNFDLEPPKWTLGESRIAKVFTKAGGFLKKLLLVKDSDTTKKNKENDKEIDLFSGVQNTENQSTSFNQKPKVPVNRTNMLLDIIGKNDKTLKNEDKNKPTPALMGANAFDPTKDLSNYQKPHLDLLEMYGRELYGEKAIEVGKDELENNKKQIEETLNNYNIEISSIKATPGPTVTLYEIVPAPGVRISRIRNLEDDVALSLAALGIRIIAPMPGKGTVGIEVPNQKKEIVSLRGILASNKFLDNSMDLPVGLGRTISNECFVADLAKMPHLLLAGATGQGKSVCLNCILLSLLYSKHPAELKMVMIDPKKVELSLFNLIEKHFLAALPGEEDSIVTDTQKVIHTLNALCIEMDQRYDLLKKASVRNVREYNIKFRQRKLNPMNGHRFLPYIVLVVDEFADLMMTAGKEIEMPIARLAQLARAIGIHLVIATQRPTVNIITGTIKANFPVRIAFRVTSKIDSRTILDKGGANQLIGRGDMLISIGPELIRLQGAFVDTPEVERIAEYISQQQGYTEPYQLPEYSDDDGPNYGVSNMEFDELFEEAAHIIVQHQQGSTSLLQRRLKLGYNRAGRIMDQLEATRIVGPNVGSKARDVLIMDSFELEAFLQNLKDNA